MNTVDDVWKRAFPVVTTGIFAGLLLVGATQASRYTLGLALASVTTFVAFVMAGNQRLFCLVGIVLLAPIALAKHFVPIPHMGGAASFPIDLIDPLVVMLLLFQLRDASQGRRVFRLTALAPWVAGIMALGAVDVLTGPLRILSAQEVVRMGKCYLLFFVLVNEVERERQFMWVLVALIGGMALQGCMGIAQWLFKISLGLQALGEADLETIEMTAKATYLGGGAGMAFRANALLGHPNLLAAYLAMLLPICVALMFSRLSLPMRALIGGATVLGMAALMMTLSRSGWFSFGIAVALLFVLSFVHPRLQRRYLFARVAAILFIVVVVAAFSGAIIKRLTESDPGAVNFRLEWNQVAWEMVQEKPLTGFGLNTFVNHLPGRTHYGGPKGLTESLGSIWPVVHNTYLLTWSEQGTIGFFFFLGLHWAILSAAVRNIRRYYNDVLFAVNLGCLCGIVALMFDGLASFYLRMPAPSRMFWVVAAIIFAIDRWNTVHAPGQTPGQPTGGAPPRPAPAGRAIRREPAGRRGGSVSGGTARPA